MKQSAPVTGIGPIDDGVDPSTKVWADRCRTLTTIASGDMPLREAAMRYTYKVDHPSIPGGSVTETVEAANETAVDSLIRGRYPGSSFALEGYRSRGDTLRRHYERAVRRKCNDRPAAKEDNSEDHQYIASTITGSQFIADVFCLFTSAYCRLAL